VAATVACVHRAPKPAPAVLVPVACVVEEEGVGPLEGVVCTLGTLQATTNADGYALVGAVAKGPHLVQAAKPGYVVRELGLDVQGATDFHLTLPPAVPPIIEKALFARTYQGNFGTIAVPGCGLHNDLLFDPFLLPLWLYNRPCFEAALQAHAVRGDNRVVVAPRADYNGHMPLVDLWHDPATFRRFLIAIRQHVNARGETLEPLVVLGADGHQATLIQSVGVPDEEAEAHWQADLVAMGRAIEDQTAGTAICWECRHVQEYLTAGQFERAGVTIARVFPRSWHGVHLVQESSAWSSRPEADDPNQGSEPGSWWSCVRAGWCDGFLYQMAAGDAYLNPDAYPNYTGYPGALGRWWEIVVRLGNDPQSLATAGRLDYGWPKVDLINFEHIYDGYNGRSDEAYGIAFCKRALELGGWGCGSGSYRRP